jgi:4'-phosphopantetheinyl transferase
MLSDSKTLLPDTIHIWTISLNSTVQQQRYYENMLSTDEIERTNRFATAVLKNRFIVCRGKLREILATYAAEISPEKLIFSSHPFGKLYLRDNEGIHFNYAYSADLAMLAIAHNIEVGVDLEQHTDVDMNAISDRLFSESDIVALQTLPDEMREQIFFKIWVRKESYLKALGTGFNQPSKEFSVISHALDQHTVNIDSQAAAGKVWKITDIDGPHGFYAAVCGAGSDWQYLNMHHNSIR